LVAAARALDAADLSILKDRHQGDEPPYKLARAALRMATNGQAQAEEAVRQIQANSKYGNQVRRALGDIADQADKCLRERHKAARRRDYLDLEPPVEPHNQSTNEAQSAPSRPENGVGGKGHKPAKPRRGRPRLPSDDERVKYDANLDSDWRASKLSKRDFAHQRGLDFKEVIRATARHRRRNPKAPKRTKSRQAR
jgi:hypothetical protein